MNAIEPAIAMVLPGNLGRVLLRAVAVVALGEALVALCWLSVVRPIKKVSGEAVWVSLLAVAVSFYAVAGGVFATNGSIRLLSPERLGHAVAVVWRGANEPADEGATRE